MKKAILILLVGLLWCNTAFSEELKHKRIECAFDIFGGTKGPKQERYWNYFFILDERKKNAKLFRLANGYIHETINLNFVASVKMIQFISRDPALNMCGPKRIFSAVSDREIVSAWWPNTTTQSSGP